MRFATMITAVGLFSTPAAAQVNEMFELVPSVLSPTDDYGYDLAVSDGIAIVGAPSDDHSGFDAAGAAYLFDLTTGLEIARLTAPVAADGEEFGFAVDIDGGVAIVGARKTDLDDETTQVGAAYLYDAATGQLLRELVPSVLRQTGRFGSAVAISGSLAIVGAPTEGFGYAYVFDVATGQELARIRGSDVERNDQYATLVELSGGTALVAAPQQEIDGVSRAGSVYVFDAATGTELGKLTAPSPTSWGYFGSVMSFSGDTAIFEIVGQVLAYDTTTLQQTGTLSGNDPINEEQFGRSVAISDGVALIGAPTNTHSGVSEAGAAYLFNTATGQPLGSFTKSTPAAEEHLGTPVALADGIAVIATSTFYAVGQGMTNTVFAFSLEFMPCNSADLVEPYNVLNLDDIDAFITAFLASDLGVADCDGSGTINVDDIDCYVAAFLGGCAGAE